MKSMLFGMCMVAVIGPMCYFGGRADGWNSGWLEGNATGYVAGRSASDLSHTITDAKLIAAGLCSYSKAVCHYK